VFEFQTLFRGCLQRGWRKLKNKTVRAQRAPLCKARKLVARNSRHQRGHFELSIPANQDRLVLFWQLDFSPRVERFGKQGHDLKYLAFRLVCELPGLHHAQIDEHFLDEKANILSFHVLPVFKTVQQTGIWVSAADNPGVIVCTATQKVRLVLINIIYQILSFEPGVGWECTQAVEDCSARGNRGVLPVALTA